MRGPLGENMHAEILIWCREFIVSSFVVVMCACTSCALIQTFHGNFSGPDQVALVSHEDDGKVFGLAGAPQRDAELSSRIKA